MAPQTCSAGAHTHTHTHTPASFAFALLLAFAPALGAAFGDMTPERDKHITNCVYLTLKLVRLQTCV